MAEPIEKRDYIEKIRKKDIGDAKNVLEKQIRVTGKHELERENPIRDLVRHLATSIAKTAEWAEYKEKSRKKSDLRTVRGKSTTQFDLCSFSEVGGEETMHEATGYQPGMRLDRNKKSVLDFCDVSDREIDEEENEDEVFTSEEEEENATVIRRNDSAKKFKCNKCEKSYARKCALDEHKRTHLRINENRMSLKCEKCEKRFAYSSGLRNHMRTHLPEDHPRWKRLECKVCGKKMSTSATLTVHERTHLENKEEFMPHKCENCDRRFNTAAQLRIHQQKHMSDDDPLKLKFECDICGKILGSAQSLKDHGICHLEGDAARPLKCDYCDKRFAAKKTLKIHTRIHLPVGDPRRTFKCDICGKELTQNGLEYHKRTQHLDESETLKIRKRFECKLCEKGYMSAQHLRNHNNIFHSDKARERPHECDICQKTFLTVKALRDHKETHLPPDQKRKVECEECGKKFSTNYQLKKHVLNHLDENDPEQVKLKKPFECNECGMRFAEIKTLDHHKNYHTGNFPYKCDICAKGFNIQALLKRHLDGHAKGHQQHVRKTKMCTLCPKRFKQLHELAQHMKRHEEGVVGDSTDDEEEVRSFECKICHKRYALYHTIATHIRFLHKDSLTGKTVKDLVISSNVKKVLSEKKKKNDKSQSLKQFLTKSPAVEAFEVETSSDQSKPSRGVRSDDEGDEEREANGPSTN